MGNHLLTFGAEPIGVILDEVVELGRMHAAEVDQELFADFNLDREGYCRLEEAGGLRSFTVRDGPRLVGYATYFVHPNFKRKGELQATQDTLFLHPDYRRGRTGQKFIQHIQYHLDHVDEIASTFHAVPKSRDYGAVLRRLGFRELETVYVRRASWAGAADH